MAGLGRRSHYRKHLTDAVLHDLPEPDGLSHRIARIVGTRGGNMFDVVVAPPSSSTNDDESADAARPSKGHEKAQIMPETTIAGDGVGRGGERTTPPSAGTGGDDPPPMRDVRQRARAPQLAFLPTKFRKLVWIKRNDFVIVKCGDEEDEVVQDEVGDEKESPSGGGGGGGFRYVITNILYKDQVRHIKSEGLWPPDPYFTDADRGNRSKTDREDDDDGGREESRPDDDGEGEGAYEDNGIVFDEPLADEFMVNTNRLATLRVEDSSSDEDSD